MAATKPQRTRVSAYGLITQEDEILLCRISPDFFFDAGKWTLPGGGIEFGESPEQAMVREVEEETGLLVQAQELVKIDTVVVDVGEVLVHGIRLLYNAKLLGGTLRNEVAGTTDMCQWWSRSELPELVDLADLGCRLALV